MSFVPFSPAPAAPAAGTTVLTRPGGAPRSQPAHTPAHAAARRAAAGPGPGPDGASNARGAFASLLDSAQQDANGDGAVASARSRGAERPAEESPAERLDTGHEPASPQPVAVEPPPPPPTSSWLLIALEHGTLTRTECTAPAGDEPDFDADALAVETAASAPVEVMSPGPAMSAVPHERDGLATIPVSATAVLSAGVLTTAVPGASDSHELAATAASVTSETGLAPASRQQGDAGLFGRGVESPLGLVAGEGAAPPRDAETAVAVRSADPAPEGRVAVTTAPQGPATVADPPSASGLGEWQGPLQPSVPKPEASGRRVDRPTVEAAGVAPVLDVARTVPGGAVSRLAQTLSRLAGEDAAPAPPPVLAPPMVDAHAGASATLPTARATEVLQRLAQAGAPAPARSHDAGAAAPFVVPVGAPTDVTALRAEPSAALPAPALPPAVGEQVVAQIVSSLKMQWRDGVGEAKLHLRPDSLGQVSLTLRVEQGAVTAVVRAESPQVQEWVLQHQQVLRQQLHDAGLRLDELSVNPDGESADRGQQGGSEESPERHPRRRAAARADSGLHFDQLL